jgi:hypothetical protein
MSFFLIIFTAYITIDSWESWIRPVIFWARNALKFRLTMENVSSIGLYYGL